MKYFGSYSTKVIMFAPFKVTTLTSLPLLVDNIKPGKINVPKSYSIQRVYGAMHPPYIDSK